MKRKLHREVEEAALDDPKKELKINVIKKFIQRRAKEKTCKITLTSCFLIYCGWPISFYLSFLYFNPILKENHGYSAEDVILHNFFLSIIMLVSNSIWAKLSYRIYPLKILKLKAKVFSIIVLFLPILILQASHQYQIFALQSLVLIVALGSHPADPLFIKHFPVFKRFTNTSFLYVLSRALVYVVTSFGLLYLTEIFGPWGLWGILGPVSIGFYLSVRHFEKLESKVSINGLPICA